MKDEALGRNSINLTGAARDQARNGEMAARELNWSEMSLEQKIERLREVVMQMESQLTQSTQTGVEALQLAREHCHHITGQVLVVASRAENFLAYDDRPRRSRHSRLA